MIRRAFAVAAMLAAGTGTAQAVTINETLTELDSQALAAPFDAVVSLTLGWRGCSGSLVSTTHVLTARHCTDTIAAGSTTVTFDDKTNPAFTRNVTAIAEMPDFGTFWDGTDISILTLAQPVTTIAPMRLAIGAAVGEVARMVGYGVSAVADAIDGTADGERWAADNIIDKIQNSLIEADFDNPRARPTRSSTSAVPPRCCPSRARRQSATAAAPCW
ncbi:trypsin-like serine protease [Jannaschia formosa]|uniref:trypsin-like serine protease n=1 Tax=Jannaschia formosa TaxID=2259592 RepID=UPI000E1BC59D|nr:trypsin-like serine protease [Jannaschia formosa]TFL19154.1 trypsin-like serine protease [Jannaschia formosa]